MTDLEEKRITDHLDVVKWCIRKHIQVNNAVRGLEYDELYQVGCLALCEAAQSYDGSVQFRTYAQVVVHNRLIDHCRKIKRIQDNTCYLDNPVSDTDDADGADYASLIFTSDESEVWLRDKEINHLLQKIKQKYSGVTLKGIEAIELKVKGYSGVEIAALYGVKPNLLAAWISRAKQKLQKDTDFMAAFPDCC